MNDSILKRYAGRSVEEIAESPSGADTDPPADLGAFGYLRGTRERAVMLELRRKDGSIMAIGYGYLDRVEFDPSGGITLSVSGQKIRIKGRNLNAETRPQVRLFEGITRHKVPWIREADNRDIMTTIDCQTIVDSVEW